MPTVRELKAELEARGIPVRRETKAQLQARLDRALHNDYHIVDGKRVIGATPQRGTCPNDEDPVTFDAFEPGDVVQQLRNTNFSMGNCYKDRTLLHYLETTRRDDGPTAEDMSSLEWPADWDVSGAGNTIVRMYDGLHRVHIARIPERARAVYVDSAKSIPPKAFEHCRALKTISLSDRVRRIEREAFKGFRHSLIIPDSVTFIGSGALDDVGSVRNPTKGVFDYNEDHAFTHAVTEWLGVERERDDFLYSTLPNGFFENDSDEEGGWAGSYYFNEDNVNNDVDKYGSTPLGSIAEIVEASWECAAFTNAFAALLRLGADPDDRPHLRTPGQSFLELAWKDIDKAGLPADATWTQFPGGLVFEQFIVPLVFYKAAIGPDGSSDILSDLDNSLKKKKSLFQAALWHVASLVAIDGKFDDKKKAEDELRLYEMYISLFAALWIAEHDDMHAYVRSQGMTVLQSLYRRTASGEIGHFRRFNGPFDPLSLDQKWSKVQAKWSKAIKNAVSVFNDDCTVKEGVALSEPVQRLLAAAAEKGRAGR